MYQDQEVDDCVGLAFFRPQRLGLNKACLDMLARRLRELIGVLALFALSADNDSATLAISVNFRSLTSSWTASLRNWSMIAKS